MQLNLKATTGNSLCFSYINNISIVRTFPRGEELLCRDQDLHYGSYEDSISPPKKCPGGLNFTEVQELWGSGLQCLNISHWSSTGGVLFEPYF